jgi:hypothetical protein
MIELPKGQSIIEITIACPLRKPMNKNLWTPPQKLKEALSKYRAQEVLKVGGQSIIGITIARALWKPRALERQPNRIHHT